MAGNRTVALMVVGGLVVGGVVYLATRQTARSNSKIINIDGDLKANITPQKRDDIWLGWYYPSTPTCRFITGYDFSGVDPFATCEVDFANTEVDNRPFPFNVYEKGAFTRKLYLSDASGLKVDFDINLHSFTLSKEWLRTGVVLAFKDSAGNIYYFEQDIKDTDWAKSAMPYSNPTTRVWMQIVGDVGFDTWTHFEILFEPYIRACGQWNSDLYLDMAYIVNECEGTGSVKYDVKNFWVTIG